MERTLPNFMDNMVFLLFSMCSRWFFSFFLSLLWRVRLMIYFVNKWSYPQNSVRQLRLGGSWKEKTEAKICWYNHTPKVCGTFSTKLPHLHYSLFSHWTLKYTCFLLGPIWISFDSDKVRTLLEFISVFHNLKLLHLWNLQSQGCNSWFECVNQRWFQAFPSSIFSLNYKKQLALHRLESTHAA